MLQIFLFFKTFSLFITWFFFFFNSLATVSSTFVFGLSSRFLCPDAWLVSVRILALILCVSGALAAALGVG